MELKPCPFCGEPARLERIDAQRNAVGCTGCGARLWSYKSMRGVEDWNRRASGWIPVGERLPEDSADVLVCKKNGRIFLVYFKGQEFWDQGWIVDEVTHWQPLPEPPK